ncbi:MAG TPA: class I SAM-dependent methyltransferase [Blastocatellia bacterium]|jgi:ubiquinone/menaquinone biosynthesis C-methylase UbiE|nr:class I SAM-dependent methyltransferase [Blastocatellia bacterium]
MIYEKFGRFYDAVMGDRAESAAFIQRLIQKHKPDAKTLLELACGTGAVLQHLAKHYEVSGLDISPEMLSVARKKLPEAPFYQAGMESFELGKKFDVIICVFDSINHVLSFADWKRIFRRVARRLAEGGMFLFDINTERKLRRHIQEPPWVQPFDGNLLIMDVTDAGHGASNWNIKVFARQTKDSYKLFEEDIKEKSFPASQIREALLERFESVKIIDPTRRRPGGRSERLYFLCRR